MLQVVVICPGDYESGGPEALHQLVDACSQLGVSAGICYWPPSGTTKIPLAYSHYALQQISFDEARAAEIVVFPETLSHLSSEFPGARKFLWWLSVDNYFVHHLGRGSRRLAPRVWRKAMGFLSPCRIQSLANPIGKAAPYFEGHLVQSHYAESFLSSIGIDSFFVSDFLGAAASSSLRPSKKRGLVTNGNKGVREANRFEKVLCGETLERLRGLSAVEVAERLRTNCVYIDFGSHPGKDRMPREAAINGCVVFVRRAGAAANEVDVPIPDYFKFGVSRREFAALKTKVIRALENPDHYLEMQWRYRESIGDEKSRFLEDVARWTSHFLASKED